MLIELVTYNLMCIYILFTFRSSKFHCFGCPTLCALFKDNNEKKVSPSVFTSILFRFILRGNPLQGYLSFEVA